MLIPVDDHGGVMVTDVADLPCFGKVDELYLDVETARVYQHKEYGGLYPFKGDRICGVAVTVDNAPRVWYVPVRHTGFGAQYNLPIPNFQRWLKDTLLNCTWWINHSILLDMMFVHHDGVNMSYLGDDPFPGYVVDTLTLSKVHYSDRMGYSLKELVPDWLETPMPEELLVKGYLDSVKSKNYADVPPDILGKYACNDPRQNRQLYKYLLANRPDDVVGIWNTEILLTPVLFDMELRGLQTNKRELQIDRAKNLHTLIQLATEIGEMTGREWTNSHACMYDLLINQYGLPVLATKWEKGKDTGRPTFDKKAIKLYNVHPQVLGNPELKRLMTLITAYRGVSQHQSLFVEPFLELMDEFWRIHSTYNQLVRTGRMSCKRPNAQQQNKRSKALIHPREGYGIIDCDYSQIEFRLIVHYINDLDAIEAYNRDPATDFHKWVAEMIGVKRKAGKTLNFGMGYGAGKRKVESELAADPDIIAEVSQGIQDMIQSGDLQDGQRNLMFAEMCRQRAAEVYQTYHEKLPNIKPTSYKAADVCRYRGYVFNAYGRRRHLERMFAHKAFNSIIQGCAMDIIKERMVAVAPRYNEYLRDRDVHLLVNVHDAVGFEAPLEILYSPELHNHLVTTLESPAQKFRVPIMTGLGVSAINWAEAAGDDTVFRDGRIAKGDEAQELIRQGVEVIGGKIR
jgi:DNA polymerase I-like protein with 3'-5' exonuclease and polymerase domains